jgi:hypothetical protein
VQQVQKVKLEHLERQVVQVSLDSLGSLDRRGLLGRQDLQGAVAYPDQLVNPVCLDLLVRPVRLVSVEMWVLRVPLDRLEQQVVLGSLVHKAGPELQDLLETPEHLEQLDRLEMLDRKVRLAPLALLGARVCRVHREFRA